MRSIADIALEIQHAKAPDRKLDIAIGEIMGFTRHVKSKGKVVWLYPADGEEKSLPRFTARIDAARTLASTLIPKCSGGFTWGREYATARINDGPTFSAATPALAICAAALSALHIKNFETA